MIYWVTFNVGVAVPRTRIIRATTSLIRIGGIKAAIARRIVSLIYGAVHGAPLGRFTIIPIFELDPRAGARTEIAGSGSLKR